MRIFLPTEHGLIAWVGVPLLAAMLIAPGWTTILAIGMVLCGFSAFNAIRRGAWKHALGALLLSAPMGVGASLCAEIPGALMIVGGLGLCSVVVAPWFGRTTRLPRETSLEVGGILSLCGLALLIALAGGGAFVRASLVMAVVATWLVLGLWRLRSTISYLLPRRTPWEAGRRVCLALGAVTAGAALLAHLPLLAGIPLLYLARERLHAPPRSGAELRRVGMAELNWALLAAVLAVTVSR